MSKGLGCEPSLAGRLADELVYWVRDTLPSWGDNDPYYALHSKAMELFERQVPPVEKLAPENMERKPFDPSNPFDACVETIRLEVIDVVRRQDRVTIFHEMKMGEQLESVLIGVLTALVAVGFSYLKPSGYDVFMQAIRQYLPAARETVEGWALEIAAKYETESRDGN